MRQNINEQAVNGEKIHIVTVADLIMKIFAKAHSIRKTA
jgi:hypothetical protein